jgi:hypothetical protein
MGNQIYSDFPFVQTDMSILAMDILEMDISEMTSSDVSEIHRISDTSFSDIPIFRYTSLFTRTLQNGHIG